MLPETLVSSYKQYKIDSDSVASWLATTARQCGYPAEWLPTETTTQPKPAKLRGRARTLARKAAEKAPLKDDDQNAQVSSVAPPKYLIDIGDFVLLAEWIAKSSNPRVEVPASFVAVLDRTIALRKRHQKRWYGQALRKEQNMDDIKLSNNKHDYFIDVLEKVRSVLNLGILQPRAKPTTSSSNKKTVSSHDRTKNRMENMFEHLALEEPSEIFVSSKPGIEHAEPARPTQVSFGTNLILDDREAFLALDCLFNDIGDIRKYLQKLWTDYKSGSVDIIAAAVTSDTAVDFARCLEEEYLQTFPKYAEYDSIFDCLHLEACMELNENPLFRQIKNDDMNFAAYNLLEPTLYPTYRILASFMKLMSPGALAFSTEKFGIYSPLSDRASKSARDKYQEDKILLLDLLPDFCVRIHCEDNIFAEDRMTRGINDTIHNKQQVPLWLTFAAQNFLDIHHILRERVTDGYENLVKNARYIENSIKETMKFHEKVQIKDTLSYTYYLPDLLTRIRELVHTDWIDKTRTLVLSRAGSEYPKTCKPVRPFLFLKNHPVYCSLVCYAIKFWMQKASLDFVNSLAVVLQGAHLYNALNQEKLIKTSWQDMDFLLCEHPKGEIFLGNNPHSIGEYKKNLALAVGQSASTFAPNRRHNKATTVSRSRSGGRILMLPCRLSALFCERYCGQNSRSHMSPDDLLLILAKSTTNITNHLTTSRKQAVIEHAKRTKMELPNPEAQPKGSRGSLFKDLKSTEGGLAPIQLLSAQAKILTDEAPGLSFGYLRLHQFCWRLLRRVEQAIQEDLEDVFDWKIDTNDVPKSVMLLFRAAELKAKGEAGVRAPPKKLLKKAAEVMEEMLKSGEGKVTVEMLQTCRDFELVVPNPFEVARAQTPSTASYWE